MDTNALGMPGGDINVMRTMLSLLFVIGAMVAAYFWLRKRAGLSGALKRRMRIIERVPLDSRRSLMLVEVDGEELMLGITHEQISTLKVLDKRLEPGDD